MKTVRFVSSNIVLWVILFATLAFFYPAAFLIALFQDKKCSPPTVEEGKLVIGFIKPFTNYSGLLF